MQLTKATFLLSTGIDCHMVCYYMPEDGEPSCAIFHFLHMHNCKNRLGSYAGQFFRANSEVEITTCHEDLDDTQYRYEINKEGILTILEKGSHKRNEWEQLYKGTWFEFVNKGRKNREPLHAFKQYKHAGMDIVMTVCHEHN